MGFRNDPRIIVPNCADPIEAEAAFDFFANSTFTDHRVRFLLTLDAVRRRSTSLVSGLPRPGT